MENQFITLQVSAKIYWGYQYKVPLMYSLSVTSETLIHELKIHMKNFFSSHNLEELKEGVDKLNLHIHQEINTHSTVVYVCSHK